MDLATIIGFIAACGVVGIGILMGGPVGVLVDGASMFIVVAGSLAVVLMRSSVGDFMGAADQAYQAFADKGVSQKTLLKRWLNLPLLLVKTAYLRWSRRKSVMSF